MARHSHAAPTSSTPPDSRGGSSVAASEEARQEVDGAASGAPRAMPLLATKLFIPRPRPGLVARPRLFARLETGLRGPLTLVVAPAGWGKSSVVAAWCATLDRTRPVAWVSLDAGDNDAARFWTYVLTALNTVCAGVTDDALARLRSPQPPPIEVVLTLLLNGLAALQTDTVLVLDDYQAITAQAVHASVTFLLDHLPPHVHLVLASRQDPPLPLARRRAQGAVTELRAADLRFTPEETAQFLTTALGIALSDDVVRTLEARSEGWIAGLQLAALSLQGRSCEQAEAFVAALAGSNRYVVDYLVEEVLAQQPAEIQSFLLRTAVVERFCAPLCERLLLAHGNIGEQSAQERHATSAPQHPDGTASQSSALPAQTLLEHVERANLFLIPLDDERRWYRYHHLFTDVLRSRLRQLDPALPTALLGTASRWCEAEGLLEEAVEYALAAADVERVAALLEQHIIEVTVRDGRFETALRWLAALPEAALAPRPMLNVHYADLLILTGRMEAARVHLSAAEAAASGESAASRGEGAGASNVLSSSARTVRGYIAAGRANLALVVGDLAAAEVLTRQVLELVPESESPLRIGALVTLARAWRATGDVTPEAERRVLAVMDAARAARDLPVLTLAAAANLGHLRLAQGRLRQAFAAFQEAAHMQPPARGHQSLPGSRLYHIGLGGLLREWNDLDAAETLLARGTEDLGGRVVVPAEVVTAGYLELARLQRARGEHAAALATLDALAEVGRQRGFVPELMERAMAARASIELYAGNLAEALRWADASGLTAEDSELPYRRESAYLVLARVRLAQGRIEPGGPFLREAERLLARLQCGAEAQGRGSGVLEILILRALAQQARRDTRAALGTLAHALVQAEPEGYVRLFADEGTPMAALLSELLEAVEHQRLAVPEAVRDYARFLPDVCRSPGGGVPATVQSTPRDGTPESTHPAPEIPPLLDPLTAREVEVLHLLAQGASNATIAAALVVSVGTVKKHVFNVCTKLGAQNRTQAVARARALHLL